MDPELTLLYEVLRLREKTRCTKFVGALTIELLREEFAKIGLNVSNRDVFIEGIPNELDLLIAKEGRYPQKHLVYSPADVLAVLEVKFRGSYGKTSIKNIKNVFTSITVLNKSIQCLYVSMSENRKYKYRITKENLGFDCFELLIRDSNLESALRRSTIKQTGDWQRLLLRLKSLTLQ